MYRVEAKAVDRRGNPRRKFSFFGKTKQAAQSNAREFFRRQRNVEAGTYEDGTFRPIAPAARPERAATRRRRTPRRKHNAHRVVLRRSSIVHRRSPIRRRKAVRRVSNVHRKRNVRRRRNAMPAALAKYWRTHRRK